MGQAYAAYYGSVIVMHALTFKGASDKLLGSCSLCMCPMVMFLLPTTAYYLCILHVTCSMFNVYYVLMGLLTFHSIDTFIVTPTLLSMADVSKYTWAISSSQEDRQ